MYGVLCKNLAILGEYRSIAEALFPQDKLPDGKQDAPAGWSPNIAAAAGFASALGIGAEHQRLLGIAKSTDEMREFLGHFQNNLDLLIQKTWVEKTDEERKERLQNDVPPFMAYIMQENFPQAIEEFGAILEELAYLFFGAQSAKDDFTEYTLRIDEQMGLFWWYGSQLGKLKELGGSLAPNDEFLWAVLLIGICYLTNF
ncbi:MAG: hypothetical protein LBQ69_05290 [Treponema sp.]|jgi:hypothetical protein|nr:hypothetical protein [Treponema sp.]